MKENAGNIFAIACLIFVLVVKVYFWWKLKREKHKAWQEVLITIENLRKLIDVVEQHTEKGAYVEFNINRLEHIRSKIERYTELIKDPIFFNDPTNLENVNYEVRIFFGEMQDVLADR